MGCDVVVLAGGQWGAREFVSPRRLRHLLLTSAAILAAGSVAQAEDVNITSNTSSVNLDTYVGTTARIFPGVTVSNGVSATTQAWTVTNDGAVNGGNTVTLNEGGTFVNSSSATVSGTATAMIFGYKPFGLPPAGGPGNLANYGTITGAVEGVTMWLGGTVTNYQGGVISTTGSGNAVSVGQGTSRTVINSGEIHADRTTGFSTGILVQGGPSTITNNATGIITGGYNGIYASASASLTFTNNGSITSVRGPAVEGTGGGTFINTGTIQSGIDGMLISNAATVTNSGTISSTGVGRSIAFSGAATHTLNLQTGSILNGNVQGGTGTDNLVLQGTGTESIAKFLSFETLSMQGGDWSVTGTGAFTTSTAVQSGTLRVNGTLTTPSVTVASAGTLGGGGTIVGNVVNNGIVAPGNSIGTLNIAGNYTQATGSTYRVEINNTPASDLINITGTATIQSGATVNVVPAAGFYTLGYRYTILTAAGGRTGTYDTLTYNAPFLDLSLAYDANNVYLDVTRSSVSFQQIAQTPNQRAAAYGVESLGSGNRVFNSVVSLDTPNALRAFDLLSGEIHASVSGTLIEDSRFLREAIGGRLRQFSGSPSAFFAPRIATLDLNGGANALAFDATALAYAPPETRRARDTMNRALASNAAPVERQQTFTAWAQGFGNWGRTNGDGNAAMLNRNTGGIASGVDVTLQGPGGALWRAGLAGAFQNTSVNVSERSSSGTIESRHLAAYAGMQHGALGLRAGASYGWSDIATRRTIAFPGFSDAASASYGGRTAQVFGEAGYGIGYQNLTLEPFAGLSYVNVWTDGFTEAGGAAALTAASGDAGTTFSTLGLRAAAPVPLALPGNALLIAKGSAGWRHAFGAVTPTSQLSFSNAARFTVAGVPIAKDAAALELGLDGRITRHDTFGISYAGQIAGSAYDHGVSTHYVRRF